MATFRFRPLVLPAGGTRSGSDSIGNGKVPAREVYRRILERRAAKSDADYENGVATLVSTIGYLDVMMHRGFKY